MPLRYSVDFIFSVKKMVDSNTNFFLNYRYQYQNSSDNNRESRGSKRKIKSLKYHEDFLTDSESNDELAIQ